MTDPNAGSGEDRSADDGIAARRSGQAFPAPGSRWDGSWWRCLAHPPGQSPCSYWERGLRIGPSGDGLCPDHGVDLTFSQERPGPGVPR